MAITLHPVAGRTELKAFVALPRLLYAQEPHYVAPLDHERLQLLDPKVSSFHTHGESAYWMARRDGRAVGRISAQVDRLATGPQHEGAGFFGCIDAIDDVAVVHALMGAAGGWLAARGKTLMRGPFLLSINGESGLLLDGQDQRPMVLMPWHPPYLAGHVASFPGCRLVKTMNSYGFERTGSDLRERLDRLGLDRRRAAFSIREMSMSALKEDAEIGRRLFNASWSGNWGFVPVSEVEMAAMIEAFRPLLRSDYGVFIEKKGETVGFALFLPNLFEIVGDLGGSPSLFGFLKLAWRAGPHPWRHRFTGGRGVLFGVAAPLVGTVSGAGVALLLVDELMRRAVKTNVQDLECGWILDDNYAMTSVVQWLGAKLTRRFGVYEATIVPARPTA